MGMVANLLDEAMSVCGFGMYEAKREKKPTSYDLPPKGCIMPPKGDSVLKKIRAFRLYPVETYHPGEGGDPWGVLELVSGHSRWRLNVLDLTRVKGDVSPVPYGHRIGHEVKLSDINAKELKRIGSQGWVWYGDIPVYVKNKRKR